MIKILLFTIFVFQNAWADKASMVEKHILKTVSAEVQKECASCQVELQILNKKIIEDIAIPDRVVADHWKGQTNLVLKLGDENRIVTAEIRWKDQVVVAKKNIRMGKLIDSKDLRVVEKDVTYLQTAYLNESQKAVGWLGKRVFQRGQVIDENMLKKPLAVKFGQPVKLELINGSLELVIQAKARGAGAVGDQIPVYIPKTRKKVTAKVIGGGRVRLE